MAWGVFFGVLSGPVNGGPTAGPFFVCCVVSSPMQWCYAQLQWKQQISQQGKRLGHAGRALSRRHAPQPPPAAAAHGDRGV